MHEYTESYPPLCVGWILTFPLEGGPQDHRQKAFDIHSGNQSSRLVAQVWQVHKGHSVTLFPRLCRSPLTALFL